MIEKPMMLYSMSSKPYISGSVDFISPDFKMYDFIRNNIDTNSVFIADLGNFDEKILATTDCVTTSKGSDLLSERVINQVGHLISKDIEYYPCIIRTKNTEFLFYLYRIKTIVDLNAHTKVLRGEDVFLKLPCEHYLKCKESFYFATNKRMTKMVASEKFKILVSSEGLNIKFYENIER